MTNNLSNKRPKIDVKTNSAALRRGERMAGTPFLSRVLEDPNDEAPPATDDMDLRQESFRGSDLITPPGNGCTILPVALPKEILVPSNLLPLIAEIDEFNRTWPREKIKSLRLEAMRRSALIHDIAACTRISQKTITNRNAERLCNIVVKLHSQFTPVEVEVVGYGRTMDELAGKWHDFQLTEERIRQLHYKLLRFDRNNGHKLGEYNDAPDTMPRMLELIRWLETTKFSGKIHPLVRVAVFAGAFNSICPFKTCNTLVGNVLTTILLMQARYDYIQYSSLERVFESRGISHHKATGSFSIGLKLGTSNCSNWLSYFLHALLEQANDFREKLEVECAAVANLPPGAKLIMEEVRLHGGVTVAPLCEKTGQSPSIIRGTLRELVRQGHLTKHRVGSGSWYGA